MKKILVIEDNLEVRENIAELLELSGYETLEAEHGKVGVKLALETSPDLIICDVMMPVLDGYGTLKILQNNPKTQQIPFIFLTAKAEKKDFRAGMNLGADDYITKPFTDVELLEAVELRLDKQERQVPTSGQSFFNPEQYFQEQLPLFLQQHTLRSYGAQQWLFDEGDTPVALYYIQEGRIQRAAQTDFGKELTLALYGAGDFLGLPELLTAGVYQNNATTITPCRLYILPKTAVEAWLQQDASIAQYFLHLLAQQSLQKNNLLLQLAYSSVRKRIAEGLLRFHQQYAVPKSPLPFEIHLSREALANLVGTTKETVTRTLSEFKEARWIHLKGSHITLLDIDALRAVPA
ncbi:MAG: response regulator [Aureispira sp.]